MGQREIQREHVADHERGSLVGDHGAVTRAVDVDLAIPDGDRLIGLTEKPLAGRSTHAEFTGSVAVVTIVSVVVSRVDASGGKKCDEFLGRRVRHHNDLGADLVQRQQHVFGAGDNARGVLVPKARSATMKAVLAECGQRDVSGIGHTLAILSRDRAAGGVEESADRTALTQRILVHVGRDPSVGGPTVIAGSLANLTSERVVVGLGVGGRTTRGCSERVDRETPHTHRLDRLIGPYAVEVGEYLVRARHRGTASAKDDLGRSVPGPRQTGDRVGQRLHLVDARCAGARCSMPVTNLATVCPFALDQGAAALLVLDQRLLPREEHWLALDNVEAVANAIETLAVRGAPAIGCVAALGLAVAARGFASDPSRWRVEFAAAHRRLAATRPTAVNLFVALDQLADAVSACEARADASTLQAAVLDAATRHAREDLAACHAIGRFGAELLPDRGAILTHCNAGALATAGYGTALGVIRSAIASGKQLRVIADETRPVLQGARLTAWELQRDGIDVTVIADNMAGALMARGEIAAAIVGADRIARNGDVANKIGTYTVAVLCKHHGIPFYVAAPWTTIDRSIASGAQIPIEERDADEIRLHGGQPMTPVGVAVRNPAFDITPAALVTAIITDLGVLTPAQIADFAHPPSFRSSHSAPPR